MDRGEQAEAQAERYLRAQGLRLLARNYRCKGGEIDLVMDEAGTTVFVEVRLRGNRNYASALESVTWHKQRKLLLAARHYLLQHAERAQTPCRFDVVALDSVHHQPQWLRAAFTA